MKVLPIFGLLILSVTHAEDAHDASIRIRKGLDGCKERAQSTQDQITCYASYSDSLDKSMNEAYQNVLAKIGPDQKKMMREAQRAWIQFRNKEITFAKSIYSLIPGTIRQQYAAGKGYSLNENRLKDLEDILWVLLHDVGN